MGSFKDYIKRNETLVVWSFIICFLLVMFKIIEYSNKKSRDKIIFHGAYTRGQFTGEILKGGKGGNGNHYLCYYKVNGKLYKSSEPIFLCEPLGGSLFDRYYPVIYDSTNPEEGQVLVFPFEYKELGLKCQDSLMYVYSKLIK